MCVFLFYLVNIRKSLSLSDWARTHNVIAEEEVHEVTEQFDADV